MNQTLQTAAKSNVQKKAKISGKLQEELICQEVLERLGYVNNFYKITAGNVFDDKWRVNVWVEVWGESSMGCGYLIKHSYFCTVREDCIQKSDPELPAIIEKGGV